MAVFRKLSGTAGSLHSSQDFVLETFFVFVVFGRKKNLYNQSEFLGGVPLRKEV